MAVDTITEFLQKVTKLNESQVHALGTAWDITWHGEGSPGPDALAVARAAAIEDGRDWEGVKKQAWHVVFAADWAGTGYTVRRGISDVAGALLVRDLISPAQFAALCEPWEQTIGKVS